MAASAVFRFASNSPTSYKPSIQKRCQHNCYPVRHNVFRRKIASQQKTPSERQPESVDAWHVPQSAELDHSRYSRGEKAKTRRAQSWKANREEPIQRHRPKRRSAILEPEGRETHRHHPPRKPHRNRKQQQYCISDTTFRYRHPEHRLVTTSFRVYCEDSCVPQQDYPVESNRRIKPYEVVWLRRAD